MKLTGVIPRTLVTCVITVFAKMISLGQVIPPAQTDRDIEYGISILIFIIIGTIFGAILGYFTRLASRYTRTLGWIGGLGLLGVILSIETIPGPNMANLPILFLGTTILCLGWGWVMGQWANLEAVGVSPTPVAVNMSRRRFLIYISATFLAAVLSILGILQYEQKQKGHILNSSAKPQKSN